jgi:hypothetical protein
MSVVVLWEWDRYDGPINGIGLYQGHPVYYDMDQAEEWQNIPEEERSQYSEDELMRLLNPWSGQYYRYSPRTFKLYALSRREFAEEETRYSIWRRHRLRQEPLKVDSILGQRVIYNPWLDLNPLTDYTTRPVVATLAMTQLMTWEEAYYWHQYHELILFQTPSRVNWSRVIETHLVPLQLLQFIARVDLYQEPMMIYLATYESLCQVESGLWRDRRAQLAQLAREACTVSPIIIYQPGSRWVRPVMRDYFRPIDCQPRLLHPAYTEIMTACVTKVSRGYLLFFAHRLGLSWSRLTHDSLSRGLQNYVRLISHPTEVR